jgi:hypothetical protein
LVHTGPASPNSPAAHDEHDADPWPSATVPISQTWHPVISVSLAKWFAGQSLHALLFRSSWYFPGTHGRHAAWLKASW